MEFGDLFFQSLDDLPGLVFLVFGGLHQLPALVNFLSEHSDGLRVLLGELDCSFDSGGVLENGVVEVLAPFDQSLLTLVGGFEGSVDLFVLLSESLHA